MGLIEPNTRNKALVTSTSPAAAVCICRRPSLPARPVTARRGAARRVCPLPSWLAAPLPSVCGCRVCIVVAVLPQYLYVLLPLVWCATFGRSHLLRDARTGPSIEGAVRRHLSVRRATRTPRHLYVPGAAHLVATRMPLGSRFLRNVQSPFSLNLLQLVTWATHNRRGHTGSGETLLVRGVRAPRSASPLVVHASHVVSSRLLAAIQAPSPWVLDNGSRGRMQSSSFYTMSK